MFFSKLSRVTGQSVSYCRRKWRMRSPDNATHSPQKRAAKQQRRSPKNEKSAASCPRFLCVRKARERRKSELGERCHARLAQAPTFNPYKEKNRCDETITHTNDLASRALRLVKPSLRLEPKKRS